jgi:intein-encoded DNA endonuclease-like protein
MSNKRNAKAIKKVKELRKKGLTYRAIMRVMEIKDVKQIWRWANYK